MTAEQIAALGPAFDEYLRSFRPCFVTKNTFAHLSAYCRGLLSDLARKIYDDEMVPKGIRTLAIFDGGFRSSRPYMFRCVSRAWS